MAGLNLPYLQFRLGDQRITFDPLLPVLICIMAWALSERYFPRFLYIENGEPYFILAGVLSSLFLVLSILFHEYGHALAAKNQNIEIRRIHLHLFGGMAELKHRPIYPRQELIVSVMGPIFSLALAAFMWLLNMLLQGNSRLFTLSLDYLIVMNLLLGVFNLIPIFPLDGGRSIRALLWRWKGSFYKASLITYKIAANIIAFLFITALISYFIYGAPVTVWLSLITVYLSYITIQGKTELVKVPKLSDLLLQFPLGFNPVSMIEKAKELGLKSDKVIVPVFQDSNGERHFISVKNLELAQEKNQMTPETLLQFEYGLVINIKDMATYSDEIKFRAEIIPVFEDERFLGLGDAHEVRFWLKEAYQPQGNRIQYL